MWDTNRSLRRRLRMTTLNQSSRPSLSSLVIFHLETVGRDFTLEFSHERVGAAVHFIYNEDLQVGPAV